MPLLMCPNDNAAMQTVQRAGVEFDMCPTCRGVWLDRGELEKMMALSRDEVAAEAPAAAPPPMAQQQAQQQQSQPRDDRYARRDDDDDDRRRYDRDHDRRDDDRRRYDSRGYDDDRRGYDDRYRKKKRFDLFDIFD